MEMYDLTAMGELLIDFTQLSTDGEGYPTLAAHPGGAPGNFLAALCRYGASAAFLGKVGDDAFGRLLVDTLARAGIETRGIRVDPTVFTTLAFVTLVDGERSFSFARKPGADTVPGLRARTPCSALTSWSSPSSTSPGPSTSVPSA